MSDHNRVSIVESTSNKDRDSDIDYALKYTRFFLNCIGVWALVSSNPTKVEKIMSKFMIIYCPITIFVYILPIYLYFMFRDVDVNEIVILLGPLFYASPNIIKHIILIFHSDLLKFCIQQMENDWQQIESQNDRDIAMQNVKIGRTLTLICSTGTYFCGVLYVILVPLHTGNTINELNQTVRPLPYPGNEIMIDLQAGYNYEIVFCNNCIGGFLLYTVVNAMFNLASIFVTHACGQIQIIMSRLEHLVEDTDAITIQNRIAFIVRRHVSVLKFSSAIDDLLREICLIEVVVSTVLICMIEYYCLLEWISGNKLSTLMFGGFVVSITFNVFIYCYVGELLKEQCQEIGKAAYMIEWYRLPGKTGLSLIMIIAMSNNPRTLTAGRIVELSMFTFCNIVKSSFAYFGMLRTAVNE